MERKFPLHRPLETSGELTIGDNQRVRGPMGYCPTLKSSPMRS